MCSTDEKKIILLNIYVAEDFCCFCYYYCFYFMNDFNSNNSVGGSSNSISLSFHYRKSQHYNGMCLVVELRVL